MRASCLRFAALIMGVALLAGCDTRLGMVAGLSGVSSGTPDSASTNLSISLNTPPEGTSMVAGDPLIVEVALHDDLQLGSAAISGVTGTDLSTAVVRYGLVNVPGSGPFREGLRDTTVQVTLQPIIPGDATPGDMQILAIVRNSAGAADTVTRVISLVSP